MSKFWKPGTSPSDGGSQQKQQHPQSRGGNDRSNNNNNSNNHSNKGGRPAEGGNKQQYSRHTTPDDKTSTNRKSLDGREGTEEGSSNSAEKRATATTGLSKAVLSMKFMKRKSDDAQIAEEEAAVVKKKQVTDMIWSNNYEANLKSTTACKLICEIDLTDALAGFPGRRSFGNFNKSVERHYQKYLDSLKFDKLATTKSSKYDVDDEEMVERYQSLIGLPRGPNQGKKEQFNKRDKKQT